MCDIGKLSRFSKPYVRIIVYINFGARDNKSEPRMECETSYVKILAIPTRIGEHPLPYRERVAMCFILPATFGLYIQLDHEVVSYGHSG